MDDSYICRHDILLMAYLKHLLTISFILMLIYVAIGVQNTEAICSQYNDRLIALNCSAICYVPDWRVLNITDSNYSYDSIIGLG